MKVTERKSRIILVIIAGVVILLLVFVKRRPPRSSPASISTLSSIVSNTNHADTGKSSVFRATQKDLNAAQQAALKITFETKLKPALEKWCKAYSGHIPFRAGDINLNNFQQEIGRGKFWMYVFMLHGTTFAIAEVDGSAHVSYLNSPETRQLMTLPNGIPPETNPSVTRDEIAEMLKVDSGAGFHSAEIRIIPTAFSSAMNGGIHVNVGGDPNNAASWKYTMVFGPDGKLNYYCKGH